MLYLTLFPNGSTFIMKDGDAQQHNEIHHATRNVFVNATDGNCGFHIGKLTLFIFDLSFVVNIVSLIWFSVYLGYLKHVPGIKSVKVKNQACWTSVVKKNPSMDI